MKIEDLEKLSEARSPSVVDHLKMGLAGAAVAAAIALVPPSNPFGSKTDSSVADMPVDTTSSVTQPLSQPAPKEEKPPESFSKRVIMLANTVFGEARGEGRRGMRAVAHVILNRANSEKNASRGYRLYGKGVEGVIGKSKAFSAWNAGDANRKYMLALTGDLDDAAVNLNMIDLEAYAEAIRVAKDVLSGQDDDITGGATHYHVSGRKPYWSKHGEITARIGNHVFYRGVNK